MECKVWIKMGEENYKIFFKGPSETRKEDHRLVLYDINFGDKILGASSQPDLLRKYFSVLKRLDKKVELINELEHLLDETLTATELLTEQHNYFIDKIRDLAKTKD